MVLAGLTLAAVHKIRGEKMSIPTCCYKKNTQTCGYASAPDILGDNSAIYYYPFNAECVSGSPNLGKEVIADFDADTTNWDATPVIETVHNTTNVATVKFTGFTHIPVKRNFNLPSSFGVSYWIKIINYTDGTLVMKQGQHTNGTVVLGKSNVYGAMYFYNGDIRYTKYNDAYDFTNATLCSMSELTDGNWHNIVFTADYTSDGDIYLYIDGTLKGSAKVGTTLDTAYSFNMNIGYISTDVIQVASYRFYNRYLTQADVDLIKNEF
jgi:hypothetical protein